MPRTFPDLNSVALGDSLTKGPAGRGRGRGVSTLLPKGPLLFPQLWLPLLFLEQTAGEHLTSTGPPPHLERQVKQGPFIPRLQERARNF